jgi:2-keto-4-pentenoate hydratase/2-oxohepta-3-ene-1,7-dioic acid hydratase in catechol pathway
MKLVTYLFSHQPRLGAVIGDWIADLSRAHHEWLPTHRNLPTARGDSHPLPTAIVPFLEAGGEAMAAARDAVAFVAKQIESGAAESLHHRGLVVPLAGTTLLAPVPRPGKLIAAWVNYEEHGQEAAVQAPKSAPLFFTKWPTAVIGPNEPIVLPRISQKVDYEAELALVIGTKGKNIPAERAYDHVAGYTILNDVSARDYSLRVLLGTPGPSDIQKSFDTFAPMGPYLVTRDEIHDPHALGIRLRIGDEVLQDDTTGSMIHRIPAIIEYLSSIATLEPGDVISTGTPSGVGFTRTPPRWLRPGETVRIEIDKIGVLKNPVVAESEAHA